MVHCLTCHSPGVCLGLQSLVLVMPNKSPLVTLSPYLHLSHHLESFSHCLIIVYTQSAITLLQSGHHSPRLTSSYPYQSDCPYHAGISLILTLLSCSTSIEPWDESITCTHYNLMAQLGPLPIGWHHPHLTIYNGQVCFLVIYVDDLLLAPSSQKFMDFIKAKLSSSFKMWDLGEAKYILGIEIKCNHAPWTISLSQSQYSHMVLEHTGMSACKPVWTPMAHNSQLSATSPDDNQSIPEMVIKGHQVSYLTVIGSLMYLILGTHPDIAYAVGTLSCFSAEPNLSH